MSPLCVGRQGVCGWGRRVRASAHRGVVLWSAGFLGPGPFLRRGE